MGGLPQELERRIDPESLGHVSAWFDNAWRSVPALIDGLEGMPFATWECTILELRQNNRSAAAINQDVIDQAIARIKQIDDTQRAWRRLGPISVSAADIKRAENETFWGLDLKPDPESPEAYLDAGEDADTGLFEPPRFYRRLFSSSQATLSSMFMFA